MHLLVNSEYKVIAGHRALYAKITDRPGQRVYLHLPPAVLPPQILLVCILQARLSERVAGFITFILIFCKLFFVNLPHISHHMGQQISVGILTERLDVYNNPRQFKALFFDSGDDFQRHSGGKFHRLIQTLLLVNFLFNFLGVCAQNHGQPLDHPVCVLPPQVYQGYGIYRLVAHKLDAVAVKHLAAGSSDSD
ncbi:MAG: hypothetical protein A4E55_02350 [Pelotomaculum sp. PtaU1.Bin035]|nr:MAG: hypothetical protein A4E55_02350 [Pelotomaculum sp. PtaU1.Bin035]